MNAFEEGQKCPECGDGRLEFQVVEGCTCFISPPCNACVTRPLVCDSCGEEFSLAHEEIPALEKKIPAYFPPSLFRSGWGADADDGRLYSADFFNFGLPQVDDFGNEYTVSSLNPWRVNWVWVSSKSSSCTMFKCGYYPPGTSKSQVEKEVAGTFGGHFKFFGNGRFEYVAYTD